MLALAAASGAIAQTHSASSGQAFPARPVKIIVSAGRIGRRRGEDRRGENERRMEAARAR
jgi:hypothetical protein